MKVNNEMVEKVISGVKTVAVVILSVLGKILITVFKFGMGVWARSSSYFEGGKEYKWEDIRFIPLDPLFVTVGDVVDICGFKVKRLGTFMVTANSTFIFTDDQPATKIVKPEEVTPPVEPIDPEIV